MRETKKQTIDRLVRELSGCLYGYSDAARRGATYEKVLSSYHQGEDFSDCWRRAYNAVVSAERYDLRRRKEVPYGKNI